MPRAETGSVTTPSSTYVLDPGQPRRVSSGCHVTTAHLACELWPHASNPLSLHWDSVNSVWWRTETEHTAAVKAMREAAGSP